MVAHDCTIDVGAGFDVRVGAGAVVHPKAYIIARCGPVTIGDGTVVEELARVENGGEPSDGDGAAGSGGPAPSADGAGGAGSSGAVQQKTSDSPVDTPGNDIGDGEDNHPTGAPLVIGARSVLEVGCCVRGSVGQGSLIEVKAVVEAGAAVGAGCAVAPTAVVHAGESVPDGTVVFRLGDDGPMMRRHVPGLRATQEASATAYAAALGDEASSTYLGRLHPLRRPTKDTKAAAETGGS